MRTVELEKDKIYCGNLLLVNAKYPVKENHIERLVPADMSFPDILLKQDAANILQLVLEKISAGNAILPVSGYRSMEEQKDIFQSSFVENGEQFTRKYVALPNHSEHQTGLAIDLGLNQKDVDFLCPEFPYEGICEAFRRAAPDYGFVERYGKDKEAITGISHEPWHFRYVGYPHSKIMEEKGLSLEEYIEFVKEYKDGFRLVYQREKGTETQIYYVPAKEERTQIPVPEEGVYQISGNNVDGFVVTIWRKKDE